MDVASSHSNPNMDQSAKQARSIFVGNIPYDASENHIRDILSSAGRIINFRLLINRETGRSKGYGFCEYESMEVAQAALRNLSTVTYNGRPLRIGPAAAGDLSLTNKQQLNPNHNTSFIQQPSQMQFPPQNFINNQINPALAKMTLPQANISDGNISLSSNQTNENNLTRNARFEVQESANIANPAATNFISYNTDNQNLRAEEVPIEIAKKLVNLSPELLHQLISQTKMLLKTDPDQARQILIDYPHLAYALLQSLIISGLIDSTEAIKMIRNTQGADTVSPIGVDRFKGSQNLQTIPSSGHSNHFNKPQDIDFNQSSKKFHMNIPQEQSISQTTIPARIDPVKMNEKNDTFSQNIDNEKAELIRQVMNLTDEQIRLLPAEQRESVIQLKSQVFGQQFF